MVVSDDAVSLTRMPFDQVTNEPRGDTTLGDVLQCPHCDTWVHVNVYGEWEYQAPIRLILIPATNQDGGVQRE